VNPSLWRQSQLIHEGGLYKVTDHLYQVRNSDIGNLTVVEGDDGLIIIDTMSGIEPARQGLKLFREHIADKPVAAVIYTHTHIDHYGGVKGVVTLEEVASGKVPIIAPGTIDAPGEELIGQVAVCERPRRCGACRHDALTLFGLMLGSLQLSGSSPLRPTSDARFLSRGLIAAYRMSPKIFMLVPLGSSRCVGCAGGWVRIEAQQHAPTWRGPSPWPTPTASRSLSN
jgi:hypothetical protein